MSWEIILESGKHEIVQAADLVELVLLYPATIYAKQI